MVVIHDQHHSTGPNDSFLELCARTRTLGGSLREPHPFEEKRTSSDESQRGPTTDWPEHGSCPVPGATRSAVPRLDGEFRLRSSWPQGWLQPAELESPQASPELLEATASEPLTLQVHWCWSRALKQLLREQASQLATIVRAGRVSDAGALEGR